MVIDATKEVEDSSMERLTDFQDALIEKSKLILQITFVILAAS